MAFSSTLYIVFTHQHHLPPRPEGQNMVLAPGYPNTTGFRKVVKMSVFIRKKAGMSDADFIAYYNGVHAQKAAPVVLKHGVLSYSLVNTAVLISVPCPSQFVRRQKNPT